MTECETFAVVGLKGGAKRARAAGVEKGPAKPLKVAAITIGADECLKKECSDTQTADMMRKAKLLMDGPGTAAERYSHLSLEHARNIREWMDEESERNGPLFYVKLAVLFIGGYRGFCCLFEQGSTSAASSQQEAGYREGTLLPHACPFLSPEGTMTRDGIKEALDLRNQTLRQSAEMHARQNKVHEAIQNPHLIAQMLQKRQTKA